MSLSLFVSSINKEITLNANKNDFSYSIEIDEDTNFGLWCFCDHDGRLIRINKFPNTPILFRRIDGEIKLYSEGVRLLMEQGIIDTRSIEGGAEEFRDSIIEREIISYFYDTINSIKKAVINSDQSQKRWPLSFRNAGAYKILKGRHLREKRLTNDYVDMISIISNYSFERLDEERSIIEKLLGPRNIIPKYITDENALLLDFRMGCSRSFKQRCKFCYYDMDRTKKKMSTEECIHHVREVAEFFKNSSLFAKYIFPIDGDFLNHSNKELVEICGTIMEKFPNARIACFAYADTIRRKGVEFLRHLHEEYRVDEIMNGIETGDPETLDDVKKGLTVEEIVTANKIIKEAGMKFQGIIQYGLPIRKALFAVKDVVSYLKMRAQKTAKLLNQISLDNLFFSEFTVKKGIPFLEEKDEYIFLEDDQKIMEYNFIIEKLDSRVKRAAETY